MVLSFLFFLATLITSGARAQAPDNAASEFFLAFSKNHRFDYCDYLRLFLTTPGDEYVDYQISTPYGYSYSGTVYPSSYQYVSLNCYLTVDSADERTKGIWVRSTDPSKLLVVSGLNYETHTSDGFLALPIMPGADQYTYFTNSMLWNNRTGDTSPSLVLLVAQQDSTVVTITPTEYVIIPYDLRESSQYFVHPGESYTVTLNWLETYQIESLLDLTGTKIVSNKPLSVFSSHECTDVPGGVTACDHLFEQVPPTYTWGRFFFLVPSDAQYRTAPEWYRIVSSKRATTVRITCFSVTDSVHAFSYHAYIADVGLFEQFQIEIDNYCYVSSDKPILVMQYAYGGTSNPQGRGDPFMMMILPNEQFVTNSTIQFYSHSFFPYNYITIVVRQEDTPSGSILVDGSPTLGDWITLYCDEGVLCGYALRMSVSSNYHAVRHTDSSVPVAVYVYGFEYYGGYGYPAAMSLKNLEVLECVDGSVRLEDGATLTEGRVEVCEGGVWGTICNDHWTAEDTDVVCRELGLLSSGVTDSFYGEGKGPILLDNVECLGVESTVLECVYDTHTADCSHSQDAGVICHPYPEPTIELRKTPANTTTHYTGYELTLTCLVSVNPQVVDRVRVTTSWFKDDQDYSNNWDGRISASPISLNNSDGLYTTSLTFSPLDTRDTGRYQCMAILSSYTGATLANASASTSLQIQDLPKIFIQLQLQGVQNCYIWLQSSNEATEESLAAKVGEGVESACACGFSGNNINQIVLQCFPDNPTKINLLLLVQATPSTNTAEIVSYFNTWISSDPEITLDDSTTVGITKNCDISVIQGSECSTPPPPSSSPEPSPSPSSNGSTATEEPGVSKARSGQDLKTTGEVLIALAICFLVVAVLIAAIVVYVLVKKQIITTQSFSLPNKLRDFRIVRLLYYRSQPSVPDQFENDDTNLTTDDGCDRTSVVMEAAFTDEDMEDDKN